MVKENTIMIVPSCSDLNRGDQALVWETKRLAEDSGFRGKFYFQTEKNEPISQSIAKGLNPVYPILEHPSRKFKNKENIKYTVSLKIRWGIVAIFDFVKTIFLLWNPTHHFILNMLDNDKKKTYHVMEQSDVVFVKGGGLLQTYGGLSSTYSMYFWTYPILLAHALKKPVYVMPNSFGPFQGPLVKVIAKFALKKCKILASREMMSKKLIENELRLNILNYADLAFELPKTDVCREEFCRKLNIPNNKKLVALTIRPYRFPKSKTPERAYDYFKSEMAIFIKELYLQEYMPVLIEHTLAVNSHENDGACIRDVIRQLDSDEYRFFTDKTCNCYDLKGIYSCFDYIVGTRFHSMIFSFGSGVPGIAISYTGNKSKGIMHDMGLDDYVIEIENVNHISLHKMFVELVHNESLVKKKINQYREKAVLDRKNLIEVCRKNEAGTCT